MTVPSSVPPVLQNFYAAQANIDRAKVLLSEAWGAVNTDDNDQAVSAFNALSGLLSALAAEFPGSDSAKLAAAGASVASGDAQLASYRGIFNGCEILRGNSGRYYTLLASVIK